MWGSWLEMRRRLEEAGIELADADQWDEQAM